MKHVKIWSILSLIILVGLAIWYALSIWPQKSDNQTTWQMPDPQRTCIAKLPIEVKLGQKIMAAGYADTLAESKMIFNRYHLGGVIIMNQTPKKTLTAFRSAQSISPIIATDQEGGTVQRYTSEGSLPAAADIAKLSTDQAYDIYLKDSKYLASLGITVNFAPVIDTAYQGVDPLPTRMYSSDPSVVAAYAGAFVKAARDAGIQPVLKHFPGIGSIARNTDNGNASTIGYDKLVRKDLIPYEKLAALHPDVMVGNAVVPGISNGRPASLSRAVVTDVLREKYGYHDALVYTDSLTAKAIAMSLPEASIQSWRAGADIALIVQDNDKPVAKILQQIIDAGKAAIKNKELDEKELNDSVKRIFEHKHIDACSV